MLHPNIQLFFSYICRCTILPSDLRSSSLLGLLQVHIIFIPFFTPSHLIHPWLGDNFPLHSSALWTLAYIFSRSMNILCKFFSFSLYSSAICLKINIEFAGTRINRCDIYSKTDGGEVQRERKRSVSSVNQFNYFHDKLVI